MVGACEEFLPGGEEEGVCRWEVPMAGMFQFVEVRGWKGRRRREEVEEEIFQENVRRGVLCHKGSWFRANKGEVEDSGDERIFFRMTFAAAGEQEVREGVRRFGESVRSVLGLEDMTGVKNGVDSQG